MTDTQTLQERRSTLEANGYRLQIIKRSGCIYTPDNWEYIVHDWPDSDETMEERLITAGWHHWRQMQELKQLRELKDKMLNVLNVY